ncbi:MAG: MoaD/ThiS family protein [Anaerolineae bacterium]|nr:MoaD/ThiS family protein [Anaerolineae bacterium]MDW8067454.1 MoaD/ThiS family protein [Anaerolineae bacterium]
MKIRIKLLAHYQQYLPPDSSPSGYETEVPPDARVEDVLAQLPVPVEESVVLVNGRTPQPGQMLQEGDVLCLFPAIGGG